MTDFVCLAGEITSTGKVDLRRRRPRRHQADRLYERRHRLQRLDAAKSSSMLHSQSPDIGDGRPDRDGAAGDQG